MVKKTVEPKMETAQKRFERYAKAVARMDLWRHLLDEAYMYAIPHKDDFFTQTEAEERMDNIFDDTAITGVKDYANNIQSILTPPFTRWSTLVAGDTIKKTEDFTEVDLQTIKEELEKRTDILFQHLDQSNFKLAQNEALQDLAVGTGVLIINEGDDVNPLEFSAVPISKVAFEQGADGTLQTFWRNWDDIPIRDVPIKWPAVTLNENLGNKLKNTPNEKINVIEGCIYYPENEDSEKYLYYVQLNQPIQDLLTEWREYTPFIGFRGDTAAGEILGRGPVLTLLPSIRVLNKEIEMSLRGRSMRSFPMMMVENKGILNSNTISLNPGALIDVEPSLSGKDPIRPIEIPPESKETFLRQEALTQKIKDAFLSDPLGEPEKTTNQSATQTQIRQKNWIRKSGATFGRLTAEMLNPILDKVIRILRKKNILSDIQINGGEIDLTLKDKTIAIEYASPLLGIQNAEDAQKVEGYVQFIGENFGPTGITATFKLEEVPGYMADKMGVPVKLINDPDTIEKKLAQIAQQAQQAVQQAAQGGTSPLPAQPQAQPTGASQPPQ